MASIIADDINCSRMRQSGTSPGHLQKGEPRAGRYGIAHCVDWQRRSQLRHVTWELRRVAPDLTTWIGGAAVHGIGDLAEVLAPGDPGLRGGDRVLAGGHDRPHAGLVELVLMLGVVGLHRVVAESMASGPEPESVEPDCATELEQWKRRALEAESKLRKLADVLMGIGEES